MSVALTKPKTDRLTSLVLEYKSNPSPQTLQKIYKLTPDLVYSVFRYYNIIKTFPLHIQEDIEGDCRTFVLLKSIDRFDPNKQTKFSTLYTWWLKSHVNSRKEFYLRRMSFHQTFDLLSPTSNRSNCILLEETLTDFNYGIIGRFKQELSSIFDY